MPPLAVRLLRAVAERQRWRARMDPSTIPDLGAPRHHFDRELVRLRDVRTVGPGGRAPSVTARLEAPNRNRMKCNQRKVTFTYAPERERVGVLCVP